MDPQTMQFKKQAAQLQNEAKRILRESLKEKQLAKNELKRGNRNFASIHAQNAVRYEQQARQYIQKVAALNSYAVDLQQAQTTASMGQTMNQATKQMQKTTQKANLKKLSENRNKIDGMKQNMSAAHDLLTNGDGQDDLNAETDDLLDTLENQITINNLSQMPTIPLQQPQFNQPNAQQTAPGAYPAMPQMANP